MIPSLSDLPNTPQQPNARHDMHVVIQRVREASVTVQHTEVARIGQGLVVLVGFTAGDGSDQFPDTARELVHLRVFDDDAGRLNRSLLDIGGEVLVVPEVTLAASLTKGQRPSFDAAASPGVARALFDTFVASLKAVYPKVATGVFQAHMIVRLANDGPVTFIIH